MYCNVLLYTKIPEGLQQKLEGLEPLSPIAGAATRHKSLQYNIIMSVAFTLRRSG